MEGINITLATFRILVVNPLKEFTKYGIFENDTCLYEWDVPVNKDWNRKSIKTQARLRTQSLIHHMEDIGFNMSRIAAICGRGGLLRPISGGTYLVNDKMIEDLEQSKYGFHVSNFGALIASNLSKQLHVPAYIADPVVVDEMMDLAKATGLPDRKRKSIFHALNQKSIAREMASKLHAKYEDLCLIVAHLGGGVTVGAHQYGRVIDVNNGFDGEGPMSFERAGSIPNHHLIDLCYSHENTQENVKEKIIFESGLKAYLAIQNMEQLDHAYMNKRKETEEVFDILAYQVAKEIGKMGAVLSGNVNAIALTGNLAHYAYLTEKIIHQISWIADVYVFPGEKELAALYQAALRVLANKEEVKNY